MPPSFDILQTIAEISLGFTGFTGIVVTFGQRDHQDETSSFLIMGLLSSSLGALFFAFFPICLFLLNIPESHIWPISSGAFLITFIYSALKTNFVAVRIKILNKIVPWVFTILNAMALGVIILLVLSLFHPGFQKTREGVYFLVLIWLTGFSGSQFALMVLNWDQNRK